MLNLAGLLLVVWVVMPHPRSTTLPPVCSVQRTPMCPPRHCAPWYSTGSLTACPVDAHADAPLSLVIAGDIEVVVAASARQVMSSADVGRAIRQLRAATGATSGAPPATARSPRSQYPSQRGGGGVQDTLVSELEALLALLTYSFAEMMKGRLRDACVVVVGVLVVGYQPHIHAYCAEQRKLLH